LNDFTAGSLETWDSNQKVKFLSRHSREAAFDYCKHLVWSNAGKFRPEFMHVIFTALPND
jgi:hypothetical protein